MAINKKLTEIVIDDGAVEVPIKNKKGEEIGVLRFHPGDFGILERVREAVDKIDAIVAPLEQLDLTPDGAAASDDGMAVLKQATQGVYDLLDQTFDGNVAEAFCSKLHPFSSVGGEFYITKVLSAVSDYIAAYIEANNDSAASAARVSAYTSGLGKEA